MASFFTVGSSNRTISFVIDETYLENLHQNFPSTFANWFWYFWTILTILSSNILVLSWIQLKDKKLIDNMVLYDLLANLSIILIVVLAYPTKVYNDEWICLGVGVVRAFVSVTNR